MIRQQIGDLLEIEYEGKFYYLVVLTKIVMFGRNVVFAHHTDGNRCPHEDIINNQRGFNVCTDLLLPKKRGKVTRIHRFTDVATFWKTRFTKGTPTYQKGQKAGIWYVYSVDDLSKHIGRFKRLPRKYRSAMDDAMFSFDLTARMILDKYTPDKNEHL